ncbi:MAG TPA: flagellar biosynthetic protein FliR [Spirochaetota bacterium]|nr:flagellar biosynthetic protein FliR [Spirochaetota bacterium]
MQYFVLQFQIFFLIMVRMAAMFIVAPFFSSGVIPLRMKGIVAFLLTLVMFPIVSSMGYEPTTNMGLFAVMVTQEIIIGLFIGFLVAVIFSAFQLAGQFFSVQIGFGINEVIDPLAQVSIPLIGQFKNLIALLLFLAMNGHHVLIQAIYRSYELAPAFSLKGTSSEGFLKFLMYAFSGMFVIALKIALPVVAIIFLITISLGILAKAAPQMNIMMLGFPFKIAVAFGMLIMVTPLVVRIMNVSIERTFKFISTVVHQWPV